MQRYPLLILSTLTILFLYGCDTSPEQEMTQPHINLFMAPALAQLNPIRIKVSITDSTGEPIGMEEKPISGEARSVEFDGLSVTPGEITITITIFYADSEPIEESKLIRVTQEQNIVNFSFDSPNQLAMGIDSDQAFPVRRDEEFSVYVYIKNAEALFGAAVRLQFDEDVISPVRLTNGTFWGTEKVDFISLHDLLPKLGKFRKPGELNMAWTRLKDPRPRNGKEKEKLATLTFKAKQKTSSTKPTKIQFMVVDGQYPDRVILRLKTQDDMDVNGFNDLKDFLPKREYAIDIR